MTTTLDRTAPRDFAAESSARLSLTPKTTLAGQLDGAWWPYSRDLETELPRSPPPWRNRGGASPASP